MNKTSLSQNDYTGLEIAVIGMAARFPGAKNTAEFWHNLINGNESIHFFSDYELEKAGIPQETRGNPSFVKAAGPIDRFDYFAGNFFDYTHSEAELMDPQTRLFHEVSWHALEDAGYDPFRFKGNIGLYAGASPNPLWEYQAILTSLNQGIDWLSTIPLSDKDYLCARISYKLDLRGPSFPIYTACSTSLVAIHLAGQGLIGGECDLALAGGVKVSYPQSFGYFYQEGMVYSPDGHCRAFDQNARGTIGTDGVGVVVLKRLEDAVENRDHIYAIIKGSAINNDGKQKVGFTAPASPGQANVIQAALHMGNIHPESLGYIETHGTATPMGDPIEFAALQMVFKNMKKHSCALGSVKTNIGHTDSAAGVASFIKTTLMLYHGAIPPSLHFQHANPAIDFSNSPFYVNQILKEWKHNHQPRRAGISSFGIGGTNAHIILEEAPTTQSRSKNRENHLLLLSAKTSNALERNTINLGLFLDSHPTINIGDVTFTLQVGRHEMKHRRMLVCQNTSDTAHILTQKNHPANKENDLLKTSSLNCDKRYAVFMFSGQGSQYINMGAGLYHQEKQFQHTMDECLDTLHPFMDENLHDLLYPTQPGKEWQNENQPGTLPLIMQQTYSQPLLFAFEYALAKLLIYWGIQPDAMIGYSLGEYVAACLSGVFDLKAALELMVLRGRLLHAQPPGAMISVPMTGDELKPLLEKYPPVSLAAENSPSCTLAGPVASIEQIELELKQKRILTMRLNVFVAGHSPGLESDIQTLHTLVKRYNLKPLTMPVISSVTGQWLTDEQALNPLYWARHMRETVHFARGAQFLLQDKADKHPVFIEIGPGRNLTMMMKRYSEPFTQQGKNIDILNMIRPEQQNITDDYSTTDRLGRLWLAGIPINWNHYQHDFPSQRVSLPGYSFDQERYWLQLNLPTTTENKKKQGTPVPEIKPAEDTGNTTTTSNEIRKEKAERPRYARAELSTTYTPPVTLYEKKLAKLWEDFFRLEQVGLDDDFFELGGDSLKAVTLVNHMHQATDIRVPLEILFKNASIRLLANYMENAGKEEFQSIDRVEEKEYYPLSPGQKRFFILQQIEGDSTGYNLGVILVLQGILERDTLETVFKKLVEQHESFRTSFHTHDQEPIQIIHPHSDFNLHYLEHRVPTPADAKEIAENMIQPFDLSRAPLLRVGLIKTGDDTHILVVDMPHIITDGTSLAILVQDFCTLFQNKTLEPLEIRYRDYCWWLEHTVQPQLIRAKSFWLEHFQTRVPVSTLPYDFPRPPLQSFAGSTLVFSLDEEVSQCLHAMARETGTTMFMVMLAIYTFFLAKISGQEDCVVGTPVAGRLHPGLAPVVGLFINTLAIRLYPAKDMGFNTFLQQVKQTTLGSFENQLFPFEELVDAVTAAGNLERDAARNPLFDLFFSFENVEIAGIKIPGLQIKPFPGQRKTAIFDLSLFCREINNRLVLRLEYCTKLFKEKTIGALAGFIQRMAASVGINPLLRLGEMEIISVEEKKQILEVFNHAGGSLDLDKTLVSLWTKTVAQHQDHVAVSGAMNDWITYGCLDECASRVAWGLRAQGVGPDCLVVLETGREIKTVVQLLGIILSGGACLPLDAFCPRERKQYILADSGGLMIDDWTGLFDFPGTARVKNPGDARNLAYVIYTSGTTGRPKGVLLEHGNLVNLLEFEYCSTALDFSRVMQYAALTFDVSFQEIFSTFGAGGVLFLVKEEMRPLPVKLMEWVKQQDIKTLFLPTAFLKFIQGDDGYVAAIPRSVRHLVVAGEALLVNERLRRQLKKGDLSLHNHYGPSETHVVTMMTWHSNELVPDVPSIGRPVAGVYILIVDEGGFWQPVGIAGEIVIGGKQTGRGYLNNPVLTGEKFGGIKPVAGWEVGSLYRTGDRGRWLENGEIEFLGRMDFQVKIRGYRIELAEIENVLSHHPCVQEVAVVYLISAGGEGYLCCYFVGEVEVAELKVYLTRFFPGYMMPAFFVKLGRLPLTANGKLDRRGLPLPGIKPGEGMLVAVDEWEKRLQMIFAGVLGVEVGGVDLESSFFDIGGHSLKATLLVSRIHKELNVSLSLADIFRWPSIRGLAARVRVSKAESFHGIEAQEMREYYPLSSAQQRMLVLHRLYEESIAYNIPTMLVMEGQFDVGRFEGVLGELIQRQEILRTSFITVERESVQRVHEKGGIQFCLESREINDNSGEGVEVSVSGYIRGFIRPFVLSRAPLLRALVVKVGEGRYVVAVDMPHIVTDGTSMGILVAEIVGLYRGEGLPGLRLQYRDFALWQGRGIWRKQEQFWLEQMAGFRRQGELPADFPRPLVQTLAGDMFLLTIEGSLFQRLKERMASTRTTLFIFLMAVMQTWLKQYTNSEDTVIGTGVAGRRHADLENVVGMFINTLPIRVFPGGKKTFMEFLDEVKEVTLAAFENQEYPFEQLVKRLGMVGEASRNPLFDVELIVQNYERSRGEGEIPGLVVKPYTGVNFPVSKFDLGFQVMEGARGLGVMVTYSTELFKPETVEGMVAHFREILEQVVDNPGIRLGEVELSVGVEVADTGVNPDDIVFGF